MNNPFSLKGKNIVITGASSGIGRECAISASRMGANVAIIGRNKERLHETLNLLEGDNHIILSNDITKENIIIDLVKKVVEHLGKIDGFVHSAGIEKTLPIKLSSKEVFQRQMNVNAFAGFEFARQFVLKKNSNNGASLIFISSVCGSFGQPGQIAYSASKGAVLAATKAMAAEFAKRQIRVNCISPGQVKDTPMTDAMLNDFTEESLKRNLLDHPLGWVDTNDIANAAIYLLSHASKSVTGINLFVDGGYSSK